MKLNELINSVEIYTTNEEKQCLDTVEGVMPLSSFTEREQVIINNLIRKSLISKVRLHGSEMVMRNEL